MDKYQKIRVVGRGSSGTVHLCHKKATGRPVILKEIPVSQMSKEERETSLTEAKVLSMLDHPNIIAYYDNFLEDTSIVIVMEYAPGGTLHDYIKQRGSALLQEEEVLKYFAQILLALEHVHSKQILHRDLKTQNLLLNKRKNVVKVGDFGISKILSSKSKACSMVGTPSNLSPEICMGRPYNQKSDIWALGCVLYELLTLKSPFIAETLPGLVQKITNGRVDPIAEHYSAGLRQLTASLLHRDPSRRPSVRQLMGHPVVIPVLCSLYLNLGALPCVSKSNRSSSGSLDRTLSRSAISFGDSVTSVLLWEGSSTAPTRLEAPATDSHVTQVAAARGYVAGVATCTRVVTWKRSQEGCTAPLYRGSVLKDKAASRIARVACGDDFTILLSETGALISFGRGTSGCLGHGNREDVDHPKIIEALLCYEVVSLACGPSHAIAVTRDHHVFAWGNAENGRLGLELPRSADSPQMCGRPNDARPTSCFCGPDCSFLVGQARELWACGSNRNRKLAICEPSEPDEDISKFTAVHCNVSLGAAIVSIVGTADHNAVLTDTGTLYMLGDRGLDVTGAKKKMPFEMVSIPDRVAHVACSDSTILAATEKGRLMRWKELDANGRPIEVFPALEAPTESRVISLTCYKDMTVAVTVTKGKK